MTPFSFTGLKVFVSNSCRSIFPSLYTQISGMIPVEQAKEVLTCLYQRHNLPDLVLDLTLKSFIKPGNTGLTTEDLVEVMRSLDETINNSKKQVAPVPEVEQGLSGDGSSSSPSPSLNDDRRTPNIVEKDGDGSITEQELNQAPELSNLDLSCTNLRDKCIVKPHNMNLEFEEDQLLTKHQVAAQITEEKQGLSRDGSSSSRTLKDDRHSSSTVDEKGDGRITAEELNQPPDLLLVDPNFSEQSLCSGKLCFVKTRNMDPMFEEDQLTSKDQVAAQNTEEKWGLSQDGLSCSTSLKDDCCGSNIVDEDENRRITAQGLDSAPYVLLVDQDLSYPDLSGKCFVKQRNMEAKSEEDQLLSKDQVATEIKEEKWGLSQEGLSSSPSFKDDRCSSNIVEKDGDGMFPVEHVKTALTCLYPGQDLPNLDITLNSFIKPGNTGLTSEDLVAVMWLLEETIINSKKQAAPITVEERGLTTIPAKLASGATRVWAKLKCLANSMTAKLNWTAINQAATSIATNCENWAKILGWVAIPMAATLALANGIKALTSARHMSAHSVLKVVISICLTMARLSRWAMSITETAGCWTMPIWKVKQC